MKLILGDCVEKMAEIEANSVDAIVTDPPYLLKFMGKTWDSAPAYEFHMAWSKQVLRVLKPGGHLLAFGGTRTYHRMVCAIEDAGFEIRDCIMWLYGSGFPKSMDVSKAIDKLAADKEAITTDAQIWQGWGTALKPANEPIVLARKPLEQKTIAINMLVHKTGAMNIDGCRIGTTKNVPASISKHVGRYDGVYEGNRDGSWGSEVGGVGSGHDPNTGRWPSNVILNEEAGAMLDQQSGVSRSVKSKRGDGIGVGYHGSDASWDTYRGFSDYGGASRFFYCAKTSRKERSAGLDSKNNHPTVKPIALMQYLVRLITPPNSVVLDPFMGSGTTGIACIQEGFDFIGIEAEEPYMRIARQRINHAMKPQLLELCKLLDASR